MKRFSFTNSKPPIDFFAQNSLQFGRRAKRGEPTKFDFSLLVRLFDKIRTFFEQN